MHFKQYDNINYTATRKRYKGVLYNMDKNCNFAKLCYAKALNGVKNGDVTNAIPELNRSLEMDRANTDALNLLGFCHYMLCDFEEAVQIWKSSLSIRPNDNKATMYMNIVGSSEFKTIMKQYEIGMAYFEQKDYKNAAFKMTNIISKKKELVKPYILAGISMVSMGDLEEGISYIEKGLQKDSGNIEAKKYINLFREKDFLPKQVSEKASGIPNVQDIKNIKHSKVPKTGIAALAVTLLIVAAFTFGSGHIKGSDEAAQTDSAQGKIEKLKSEHFESKDKAEPGQGESGDNVKLTEESEESSSIGIGSEKVQMNMKLDVIENEKEYYRNALKLYKQKNYMESAPMFARIADIGQEKKLVVESIYLAALGFEKTENFQNAIEYYKKYIDGDRNGHYYDDSMYNLGLLYYRMNDIESAVETMEKLKKENPNSIYVNSKVKHIISLQKYSQ